MDPTFAVPHLLPNLLAEVPEDIGWYIFGYEGLIFAIVLLLFTFARRGIRTDNVFKGLLAQSVEHVVLFIENICKDVIGPHGRKYAPYLAALWCYIIVGNFMSTILNFTPTAEFSLNLSLAIISVVYVQWEGIRSHGLGGHLKHFAGPKMTGALVLITGLLFVIEITSETMKMLSLSLRLYGNIHGGHEVVSNLNTMLPMPIAGHVFYLPLGGLLLPLKLLPVILQAYIFVILSATYLGLVTGEGHAEEEHHGATSADHAAVAA